MSDEFYEMVNDGKAVRCLDCGEVYTFPAKKCGDAIVLTLCNGNKLELVGSCGDPDCDKAINDSYKPRGN